MFVVVFGSPAALSAVTYDSGAVVLGATASCPMAPLLPVIGHGMPTMAHPMYTCILSRSVAVQAAFESGKL